MRTGERAEVLLYYRLKKQMARAEILAVFNQTLFADVHYTSWRVKISRIGHG